MSKIMELIRIVSDALDTETSQREYNWEIRKKRGLPRDVVMDVQCLNGYEAYRIGELSERCRMSWSMLSDICMLMDIDQNTLLAAVKSMRRWERHNGRWGREIYPTSCLSWEVMERMMKFITKNTQDSDCYESTGRRKAWCE